MIRVPVAFEAWTPLGERILAGNRPLLPDDAIAVFCDPEGIRHAVHGADLCAFADLDPLGMAHDAMGDAVEQCVLGVQSAPIADGRVLLDRRHRTALGEEIVDAPALVGELDAIIAQDVLAVGRDDGPHRRATFAAALGLPSEHLEPEPWLAELARHHAWDPATPTATASPAKRRLYVDLPAAGRARAARTLAPLREAVLLLLTTRVQQGARCLASLSNGAEAARERWFDLGHGVLALAAGDADGPLRWRRLAVAKDLPRLEEAWTVDALLGATVVSPELGDGLAPQLEARGLGPRLGPALLARMGAGASLPPRAELRLREVAAPVWSTWIEAWWSEVDAEDPASVRRAHRYEGMADGLERLALPTLAERVRAQLQTIDAVDDPTAPTVDAGVARGLEAQRSWSDDSILDVLVGEAGEVVSASARALLRRRPRVGLRWLGVWQDFLADLGEDVAWT